MVAIDAKTKELHARNKAAFMKSEAGAKAGKPLAIPFAFAIGKNKDEHGLLIDIRKKPMALGAECAKTHKNHKGLAFGTITIVSDGGRLFAEVQMHKKVGNIKNKLQESLNAHGMNKYKVRLPLGTDDEDEEDERDDAQATAPDDDDDDAPSAATARGARDDDDDDDAASAKSGQDRDEDDDSDAAAGDDDDSTEDEDEDDEDEDEDDAGAATAEKKPSDAPAGVHPERIKAVVTAHVKHQDTTTKIVAMLKDIEAAVMKAYADQSPEFQASLKKSFAQTERLTAHLHNTHLVLEKAHKAKSKQEHEQSMKVATAYIVKGIQMVQNDPLLKHLDANPFGVKSDVRKHWLGNYAQLAEMAKDKRFA